jgi:hypothetical protein
VFSAFQIKDKTELEEAQSLPAIAFKKKKLKGTF